MFSTNHSLSPNLTLVKMEAMELTEQMLNKLSLMGSKFLNTQITTKELQRQPQLSILQNYSIQKVISGLIEQR